MAIIWPELFKATDDFKTTRGDLEMSQDCSENDYFEGNIEDGQKSSHIRMFLNSPAVSFVIILIKKRFK